MQKIDMKAQLKTIYSALSRRPTIIEVPEMNYLKIDGRGNPSQAEFQEAAQTLFPIAYTLKFMVREKLDIDFKVMPMEVIWNIDRENKEYFWTMMLMQPGYITNDLFITACHRVREKHNPKLLDKARFDSFSEGLCAQIMHKGSYENMNSTLEKMLMFINQEGYTSNRDTHDIYLNNVTKTKHENLKTIMRLKIWR